MKTIQILTRRLVEYILHTFNWEISMYFIEREVFQLFFHYCLLRSLADIFISSNTHTHTNVHVLFLSHTHIYCISVYISKYYNSKIFPHPSRILLFCGDSSHWEYYCKVISSIYSKVETRQKKVCTNANTYLRYRRQRGTWIHRN